MISDSDDSVDPVQLAKSGPTSSRTRLTFYPFQDDLVGNSETCNEIERLVVVCEQLVEQDRLGCFAREPIQNPVTNDMLDS